MKKRINLLKTTCLFICIFCVGFKGYAQIQFEQASWDEVKTKAQQENKDIFIDVYTDWCGPCKKMDKEIFSQQEVGDYINKRFVSYKLNAEKGEGIQLAQEFSVAAFPTLLFVSSQGEVIHRDTGYKDKEALFSLVNEALDPEKNFSVIEKEYNNGNRDRAFLLKYFKALRKVGGSPDYKLGDYLATLSQEDLLNKENYDLIMQYGYNVKGKTFKILIDNFESFAKIGDREKLIEKIEKRFILSHSHHVGAGFAEKYVDHSIIDYLKTTNYPYKERLLERIDINFLGNKGDRAEMVKKNLPFLKKYSSTLSKNDIAGIILKCAYAVEDKTHTKKLLQWSNQVIHDFDLKTIRNYTANATLHQKLGDFDQALQSSEEALKLAKQSESVSQIIRSTFFIAQIHKDKGDSSKALELAKQCLAMSKEEGVKVSNWTIKSIETFIKELS